MTMIRAMVVVMMRKLCTEGIKVMITQSGPFRCEIHFYDRVRRY